MSPVGPIILLILNTLFMLAMRSICQDLEGLPKDDQAVIPVLYRVAQVAVVLNIVWLVVAVVAQIIEVLA